MTGKRKRDDLKEDTKRFEQNSHFAPATNGHKKVKASVSKETAHPQASAPTTELDDGSHDGPLYLQIVTGSYERVLHGISARIPLARLTHETNPIITDPPSRNTQTDEAVTFSDSFLFAAHASAVRCLALSPPTEADKRFLATGSSDERINLYSLSTVPPPANATPNLPSLSGNPTAENPRNRSLGSLIHHDRAITCLRFPGKSKLFSAAEDATIAISRTRDWTVLSSIKAPIPKPQGRPSGDTAGPGEIPAGINDFAIHPSQKLMLSVGRGERCMRLWNLMTGKKAGVLNFDRDLLARVGEGRFSSGEGRSVLWDGSGENFVLGFERGAVVFGIDSKPKAIVKPSPSSKIHRLRFVPMSDGDEILAVSTEDGRIEFFDINASSAATGIPLLPSCQSVAQLGGRAAGVVGRIKDFDVIRLSDRNLGSGSPLVFVTGSSDGAVRLWAVFAAGLRSPREESTGRSNGTSEVPKQVGQLVATLETGNRITCLGAFIMNGKVSNEASIEDAFEGFEDASDEEEGENSQEDE